MKVLNHAKWGRGACLLMSLLMAGVMGGQASAQDPQPSVGDDFYQDAYPQEMNPVADPAAVVVSGKVRFTVLTSRMIRIEYSSKAAFEDRATLAIVNRRLPVPEYTTETEDGYLYIRTRDLELRYKVGSVPKATDKAPTNLCITYTLNGQQCRWYPGKDESMNLLGTNRTLDTAWGDNARNKLEKGLLSREGWSIIDESPSAKRGDGSTTYPLERGEDGILWWKAHADANATDWYFLGYGHDYKQCIYDFTRVGGRVPLPPKYIFGYWYSRYWAYTQTEFQQLIREVESNDIPMDVLIMDMDWHKSGWTGWSWNKTLIPSPTALMRYMHTHGLKTALNLHPADGVAKHEDQYAAMKADLGYPANSTETIPWAIEDHDFFQALMKNIIHPHEKEGVDFWWLDWQQHLLVNNMTLGETFWCNHTFFEDMRVNRPDVRPVIYHRWGGLGSHRYPICFSGDTWAAWSTLGYEIFFTSAASNVCYAYWGHDLGGHQGGNNDPELMQRWLQFGVYTPIFRTHATNDRKLERRIWKYSNFNQLRETIRQRVRIFPYLYTAARETYDTGVGMNRPLYYDYPEDANAYLYEDEYMYGNDMLVAPIYTPAKPDGYSTRTIWLPKGQWWDVTAGILRQGSGTFNGRYTLDEFPVFYKAGSVIPNYPVQRTVQRTPEKIILKVVPGASGTGSLYEDDGNNQDYTGTAWARTTFLQTVDGDVRTLTIGARKGNYEGMPATRTWSVEFLGQTAAPERVSVDGQELEADAYEFDAEQKLLTVTLPQSDCQQDIVIQVKGQTAKPEQVGELPTPEDDTPADVAQTGLWIEGSAVPGGRQKLTRFITSTSGTYTYKFHGTLNPGELYIVTTEEPRASRYYYAPKLVDANIVCKTTDFTAQRDTVNAAWMVLSPATNYRFTVSPTSSRTGTVEGELFNWWYECWLVGGCVEDMQRNSDGSNGWQISAGKAFERSSRDPNKWTWTGELKNYTNNVEPKRFKINGQYGWSPKVLHPFKQDTDCLTATQVWYNGSGDYKWVIQKDGYYRITTNVFRETIRVEYLGTEPPVDYVPRVELEADITVSGRTITVSYPQEISVHLYSLDGRQVDSSVGTSASVTAPQKGLYILHASNGAEDLMRKIEF